VLVLDEVSRKLIDNVVKEDDILNENITSMAVFGGGAGDVELTWPRH
jgi:hypothetical protein